MKNNLLPPQTLPLRELGRSGLQVSALGLGCMGMSDFYGAHEDEISLRTLYHALEIGVTFWDTSDMYGIGHNETLIGRALAGRRDEAVVATKFGINRTPSGEFLGINGRPEYVRMACDRSLQKLGIDTIDLYFQHRVDRSVPIEETVGAMAELVQAGKVRYLGLSEAGPATLARACAVHPIAALQTEYSLWTRDLEAEILPVCRQLGIGLVAYSPLGRGFLTGAIRKIEDLAADDWRRQNPRFQGENFARNLELLTEVEKLAAAKAISPVQLVLAWVLSRGNDVVPIPGTRRAERLDENVAALAVALGPDDLARIDEVFPWQEVAGTRYPEASMAVLNG